MMKFTGVLHYNILKMGWFGIASNDLLPQTLAAIFETQREHLNLAS